MLSSTKIIGYCQPLVINQGETTQLKISSNSQLSGPLLEIFNCVVSAFSNKSG